MNPGGGSGWDEPPLDIQIPDDARELDREVLAYHRELRAKRRRNRLRRLAGPFAGHGTVMPLLASILAVCLVAGAMLSVATFSPATAPAEQTARPATAAAAARRPRRAPGPADARPGLPPRPRRPRAVRDQRFRVPARPVPALQDQPGQPLGEPLGLVDPAGPGRPLCWLGLIRSPALTRGSMTATIFFRPTGVRSRRPLR